MKPWDARFSTEDAHYIREQPATTRLWRVSDRDSVLTFVIDMDQIVMLRKQGANATEVLLVGGHSVIVDLPIDAVSKVIA